MTATKVNEAIEESSKAMPWWVFAVSTIGFPAVAVMLWYVQVFKPDQDSRRELEHKNSETLVIIGQSMQMLVEQDRRREINIQDMMQRDARRDASMSEMLKNSQEQTRILQQIMIDQRAGAWNEPKKNGNHAGTRPDNTTNSNSPGPF
jgi:hypothetical protein